MELSVALLWITSAISFLILLLGIWRWFDSGKIADREKLSLTLISTGIAQLNTWVIGHEHSDTVAFEGIQRSLAVLASEIERLRNRVDRMVDVGQGHK